MNRLFGGADTERLLKVMNDFWPDLRKWIFLNTDYNSLLLNIVPRGIPGKLVVNYVYGLYQSERSVLDDLMISQITIASLLTMDYPTQLGWHMRGWINLGGTKEQVKDVLETAKRIVEECEVSLKNPLPDVEDTIHAERLV